jgi:hypothetical protein
MKLYATGGLMKWIAPVLVSLFAVGCSSLSNLTDSGVHTFTVDKELVAKAQNFHLKKSQTRGPASVQTDEDEIEHLMNADSTKSGRALRRVYFSLLYQQYHQLSYLMTRTTDLKFCPQFHHDKTAMDGQIKKSPYKGELFKSMETYAVYFPETNLAHNKEALTLLQNVRGELAELCDEGVTDDYYKLENVVTYFSTKESFHRSPEAMESLLKMPVFAHLYYLKTVEAPFSVADTHFNELEQELLDRTGAKWVHQYVVEVRKKRLSIVQSAMLTH